MANDDGEAAGDRAPHGDHCEVFYLIDLISIALMIILSMYSSDRGLSIILVLLEEAN